MHPEMARPIRSRSKNGDPGMALILVMLAMTVLAVLVATIVFTAHSETLASSNYQLDTQADYLAKAGIQQAVNWFRSSKYQAVLPTQAPTYYSVVSDGSLFNLYTATASPVQCVASSPSCSTKNATVQLIGYGSGSSNYPNITNAGGTVVSTEFANDLVNVRVTGDPNNSGTFSVNAQLLNYQVVNTGTAPALSTTPVETWLITSQGTWTGGSSQSGTIATAVEQAIIQPIFTPTWGNALYGYCSVSMGGSSGTCTDAFNSAFGAYGGGNKSIAAGACDTNSTNVIAAGAGVGANGGVTLSSNVTVAGNVTIGSSPSSGCTASGYSGNTSSVLGQVVNGPHKNPPATPTFRSNFPTGAPSYSGSQNLPLSVKSGTWPSTFPSSTYTNTAGSTVSTAPPLAAGGPCMDTTCDGSQAHPFEVSSISISSNGTTVQLLGGPDVTHPVYYDMDSISESGKALINVSGYVVINVRTSMSITGNGVTNGVATDIPPEAVQINYAGTSGVSLGGNGAISAIVNAPNATVTLGGGGSKGYMVGSIQANNVSVQGGYPIHYDLQLNRLGGTLGTTVTTAYCRKKM